jgi:hypothetical protein
MPLKRTSRHSPLCIRFFHAFESESCGVKFSHATWQDQQVVTINGQSDLLVNINDRIVFLRLYNSDAVEPNTKYWSNIHLPDIKVYIIKY